MSEHWFVAWFDRQPTWKQDQVSAHLSAAMDAVAKFCAAFERWEQAGVDAAEEFANGGKP